jgi:hypothetical protein
VIFYMQYVLGYSPIETGLSYLPQPHYSRTTSGFSSNPRIPLREGQPLVGLFR